MVKIKKGFKVDRIKARRDPANLRKRKGGERKDDKSGAVNVSTGGAAAARPKVIKFDTDSMKDYITGFHQRKNQRRMYAIKKAKDEHRAQVNTERKQTRETRRQIYNNLSKFPITETFRLAMPGDSDDEHDDNSGDEGAEHLRSSYTGALGDTVVDVDVAPLDLGTGGARFSTNFHGESSDEEEEEEEDQTAFPAPTNPFAFPTTAAPAKVRLIRKKK